MNDDDERDGEFLTIGEAAALVYPSKTHAARTKRLKRQIFTRQQKILAGSYPTLRTSPQTLERLRAHGTILHGNPARGGVLRVNLGELRELLPELFAVQWHRAAAELRNYIASTEERFDQIGEDLGATAEASWCLYSELQEQIAALRREVSELRGGQGRTQEPGFCAIGEREQFSSVSHSSSQQVKGPAHGHAESHPR